MTTVTVGGGGGPKKLVSPQKIADSERIAPFNRIKPLIALANQSERLAGRSKLGAFNRNHTRCEIERSNV